MNLRPPIFQPNPFATKPGLSDQQMI